jgi:hypothetical protein
MAQGTIKIVTQQNSRLAHVVDPATNQQIPVKGNDFSMHDGQAISFDVEHDNGVAFAVNLRPQDGNNSN